MKLSADQMEKWIIVLEDMLHDADLAEFFLFGIHIDLALNELCREAGRWRYFPNTKINT